jgi:hypothetical protein
MMALKRLILSKSMGNMYIGTLYTSDHMDFLASKTLGGTIAIVLGGTIAIVLGGTIAIVLGGTIAIVLGGTIASTCMSSQYVMNQHEMDLPHAVEDVVQDEMNEIYLRCKHFICNGPEKNNMEA